MENIDIEQQQKRHPCGVESSECSAFVRKIWILFVLGNEKGRKVHETAYDMAIQ